MIKKEGSVMERESEYLLHLLGAYLRDGEPEPRTDVDWDKLVDLAKIHSVDGILGYLVSWPICPDAQLKKMLRSRCLHLVTAFARRGAKADALSAQLDEKGIDHILMKGYVLRQYYPVPELRTFGDIDLVIRPEDRAKSHALMCALGYEVKTDWEPVYSYIREGEFYEIHTQIMEIDVTDRADYRSYFRDMWPHARPVQGRRYEFTPEYHFLYMLTHIAKHVVGSGAGIRMYLDVAAFIRHFGPLLDWEYVRRELEALQLASFGNTVLHLVQRYWGIESPIPLTPVEEQTLERFLELTMEGGIFGQRGRDSGVNTLKQQEAEASRMGTVAKRLFPPAESIETRYTYLQGRRWLVPVAWAHRLFLTAGSWRAHAEEARSILSADGETVRKIRDLYREIGL